MPVSDGKSRALRTSGAYNPQADQVTDPLFEESAFFDARDLIQVKYEMLRRVESDGWNVTRAADRFGFSRPTYYQAKEAFEEDGLWGLVPERRGPRGPHKLTAELVDLLRSRLEENPELTWRDLADELEQHVGLRVHPRTIKRRLEAREKKR